MTTDRPLKILQIASSFPDWGGTELHLLNLSEQLKRRGHCVTISCRPDRFVEREAKGRGLETAALVSHKRVDLPAARAYRHLLATESFDVVHAHWKPDYLTAPLVARQSGVPAVVMSYHSPYAPASPLLRYLYGRRIYDRIIAVSDSVRRSLVGRGMPAEKTLTIHHGTDTDSFRSQAAATPNALRQEWDAAGNRCIVGMAGRVSTEKGGAVFLQALAKTPPGILGVLIGDGPQAEEYRTLAGSLGIADRVRFVGFRSDIASAIGALDTLVLASTWAEPCAAVIQQAMALGKPVIGTDIGGTPEMIDQQKTGLLVPPADPDALAKAITTLASDPEKRRKMGDAGRERADELFTLSRMVDRVEALYYDILRAKRVL